MGPLDVFYPTAIGPTPSAAKNQTHARFEDEIPLTGEQPQLWNELLQKGAAGGHIQR